jgi:hypothetical protein
MTQPRPPKTNPRRLCLALLSTLLFAGCVTQPEMASVRAGMSREDLRFYFGEPVRIQATDSGGEDWYYRFVSWTNPTVERTVSHDSRSTTSSSSYSKDERPIHLSPDGHVMEPLPEGKLVGR